MGEYYFVLFALFLGCLPARIPASPNDLKLIIMKKRVKINIKPKIVSKEIKEERDIIIQDYDEIQNMRREIEWMKMTMNEMTREMNEMRRGMNEMSNKLEFQKVGEIVNCSKDVVSDFDKWSSELELTLQDLEMMFECNDIIEWASKFIVADLKKRSGHPHPLCAVKGSKCELLIYGNNAWKKMSDQEFASTVVNKVFKKLLSVFTAWKNENYSRILTSEHFSTLYHLNYARILSFNENASKLKIRLFRELH